MLSIRKAGVIGVLAACVAVGFFIGPSGEAQGGMSSSALTGVMYTWTDPGNLIVSFKVIDSTNGNIVWQSNPNDINVVDVGVQVTYDVEVDENFRPDDPKYEWVMVVNAVRATSGVYWANFVFNDVYDLDHVAPDVPGMVNIMGRITESHVTISQ